MRWEKTDERDRAYSRWHRQFTGEYRFVDIDHVEYCPYCNEPLALIEIAIDNEQNYKCADITTLIAKKINCFAFICLYKLNNGKIVNFRIKYTNPISKFFMNYSPEKYLRLLKRFHTLHNKVCKNHKQG